MVSILQEFFPALRGTDHFSILADFCSQASYVCTVRTAISAGANLLLLYGSRGQYGVPTSDGSTSSGHLPTVTTWFMLFISSISCASVRLTEKRASERAMTTTKIKN